MKMLRLISSVSASALISFGWLAQTASAQASCDWYAKTAMKQQQENEQRKCGLKGSEWSTDLRAHLGWCRSVAPDEWRKQAQLRDQQLAACAKR